MDTQKTKVLLVEDNPGDARLIRELLTEAGEAPFNLEHVDCLAKGLSRLAQGGIDVILLDLSLPDSHGLESLGKILARTQAVPIVVLSGLSDEAVAVKAVQEGAQDYLVKGSIDSSLLIRALRYAIERQRLRVAWRESEARYRLLADNVADVIWTADLKGRINYVSPSVKNLLGYTVDETVKLEMKDILTPDSAEQAKRLIRDQITLWNPWVQHMPLSLTLEHVRKDGSTLWSEVKLSFLCNEKRVVTGILGVTRDVTERKKAEEAINESETQHRSLVETASKAGLGITIVRNAKDKEAVFVFANDEYCKISGYSREELLGRSSWDTIPPENLALVRERYERRQKGESPPSYYETILLRKDGTRLPIEISVSVFNYRGEPATVSFFKDITKRKEAEETLRKSEERYRLLADNAIDVIWTVDMQGRVIYISPSVTRLLGYTADEAMATKLNKFFTPASAETARNVIEEEMAAGVEGSQGSSRSLVLEHVRKDGSTIWTEVVMSFLRDKQGRLTGIQGVTRDISERRNAEEALRESEERFRAVFEGTSLGIALVDFEGKPLGINPAFEKILGYNPEEFAEMAVTLKYLHPDDAMMDAKLYIEMLKGKRDHYNVDKRYIRKNGEVIWGRQNLSVVRNAEGKPKYFVALVEDITEHRKIEEELRQSEERYRELFENANDIIYTHDLAGKFTSINKAGEQVTGYKRDEVLKMNITDVLPPEQVAVARQMIARKIQEGGQTQYELEIITKDGQRVLLEVSTRLIYEDGKPAGVQGIGRDITERKKMEDALRDSEERHRLYFENASDVIYSVDPEGTILSMSPAVERLLGYKPEELIGRSMAELNIVPPEKLEQALIDTMRALAGERIISPDGEFFAKDGSVKFGEISGAPIFSRDGKVIAAIFVARDVTERKMMEEEVRRLSDAVRMSRESVFIADLEGKVVDASEAALKMFGVSDKSDLVGRGVIDLVAPEDRDKAFENLKKTMLEGQIDPLDYHILRKDGSTVLAEVSASAIKSKGGEFTGFVAVARDITERKRMEDALRQSEYNYRKLFDSTIDGMFVIDAETMRVVFGNQAAARVYGFGTVEEGLGVNPLDFLYPEDRERAVKIIVEDMFEKDLHEIHEFRTKTKDGGERWVSIVGTRTEYQGKPAGLVSFRDITEQKVAKDALRESEERFRRLVSHAPDIIFRWSVEKGLEYVSPAVSAITGYSVEELVADPALGLKLARGDDPELIANYKRVVVEGISERTRELSFVRRDGKRAYLDIRSQEIRDEKGKIVAFEGILRDITERKLVEEALRQSEQSYKVLFESTLDGLIVLDAETMKLVLANETAAIIGGLDSPEDLIGMNPLDILPPDEKDRARRLVEEEVFEKDLHNVHEYRMVDTDGKDKWISAVSTRTEFQGRMAALVSIRDVTEQKKAEEEKQRLEEQLSLAGRLAAVGELAAGVAHELNNPITAIRGFAQLLAANDTVDRETKKDLETIYREAQRAAKITQNLLAFARRHEPEKSLISINEALERTLELRIHQMKVNNIELEMELDPNLPRTMADFHHMQQVFMNIINNAEQAMVDANGKGKLVVRTQKSGKMIQITFTDNGPGIPEDNLKRIFDPFFTTKEVGKGTGLGLSICYGLVEAHGGRIYATSKPGRGATFVVEIPIVHEDKDVAEAVVINRRSGGTKWKKSEGRY